MRVFFNHLAKCGGTSIGRIAKDQYKDNFHVLSPDTSIKELKGWLSKEDCFINSELFHIKDEAINIILGDSSIKRIILGRDPIDRFKSFLGHSNRERKNGKKGLSNWGLEDNISHPFSASSWLECSLKHMELLLLYGDRYHLSDLNSGLFFPVYSQWWLASYKSCLNFEEGTLTPYSNNIYKHIETTRKYYYTFNKSSKYIGNFLKTYYILCGCTEKMESFVHSLITLGILKESQSSMIHLNKSKPFQNENKELFYLNESLISKYFALIPEDFYFHSACQSFPPINK